MLLATLLATTMLAPQMPAGMASYTLILFQPTGKYVSLKSKAGKEMAEQQMANLNRLAADKNLLFSASLDSREFRGIAILKNSNPAEAVAEFENDPFVKAKIFKLVATKWWASDTAFKPVTAPIEYVDATFGILWSGKNVPKISAEESAKVQAGHMANIVRMADIGFLKVAGPFENGGKMRGVFMFPSTDQDRIRREASKDPAVSGGRLELKLYKMKMASGSIG